MKIKTTTRTVTDKVIIEPCCEIMKSHISSYHDDSLKIEDGKITFCGWEMNFCLHCGKKINK